MTHRMIMRYLYVLLVLFVGCTMQDDPFNRNNPFDPGGGNFSENQPPHFLSIVVKDSAWFDYDHDKEEGTLILALHVSDPNQEYDTLTCTFSWGGGTRTDTVIAGEPVDIEIPAMKAFDEVSYSVRITDIAENSIDTAGVFSTPDGVPPAAPKILEVGQGEGYINVYWSSVAEADSFRLYRSDAPENGFHLSDSGRIQREYYRGRYYSSDYVPDYHTYWYRVASVNEYGECRSKEPVPGRLVYSCLPTPSRVYASNGEYLDCIRVRWNAVSSNYCGGDNAYYVVYRRSSENEPYLPLDSVEYTNDYYSTSLYYYDSVTVSQIFYYKVAVFDDSGRGSDYSYAASGYLKGLSSPYSVTASEGTYDSHILVTWGQVSGAEKYIVYRSESSSGDYEPLDTVSVREYRDSTVETYGSQYYRIAAMDHRGRVGKRSSYDSGRLKMLSAPTGLTASDSTHYSYVYLNWASLPGANGYVVYRARYTNGSYWAIDTVETHSYVDTIEGNYNTYYYKVAGLSSFGEPGSLSKFDKGSVMSSLHVRNVNADNGVHWEYVTVTWDSLLDATTYVVYRKRTEKETVALDTVTNATRLQDTVSGAGPWFYAVAVLLPNGTVGEKSDWAKGISGVSSSVSNLTASEGTSVHHIEVLWDGVPSAVAYIISSARDDNPTFTVRDTLPWTTFRDSVPDFRRYYYYVTPLGPDGTPGISGGPVEGFRAEIPAPVGITATTGEYYNRIVVGWEAVPNAENYIVERRKANEQNGIILDTISAPPYVDTTIEKYVGYEYRVFAFVDGNMSGPGQWVRGHSGEIAPPAWLGASDGDSDDYITLSWSESGQADRYVIYRSDLLEGPYHAIDTVKIAVYHDNAPRYGPFFYKIASMNSEGIIGELSEANEGYLKPVPAPKQLGATYGVYPAEIRLTWNALSDVSKYAVSRLEPGENTFLVLDTVAGTEYHDRDVSSSEEYTYKVAGIFPRGMGTLSEGAVGRTMFALNSPTVLSRTGYIELTWSSIGAAEGYHVYRGANSTDMTVLKDISCSECSITDSIDGTWYYAVSYYNSLGAAPRSAAVRVKTLPPPPTGLRVVDSVEIINLEWEQLPNASSYYVFRGLNGEEPVIYGKTPISSYVDPAPKISSAEYRVSATVNGEKTALSEPVFVRLRQTPAAPGNPTLVVHADYLALSWEPPSNGAPEEYRIYRSTVSPTSGYEFLAATKANAYHDSVVENREYYYKISALAFAKEGPKSESVGGHIYDGGLFPPAPTGVSATKGTMRDTVFITWRSVQNVSGYRVFRNQERIAQIVDTFYYDPVETDTEYEYRIKAYNAEGESPLSDGAVGYRTPILAPSVPRNVTASDTSGSGIRISWDPPTNGDVKGYYVYRSHSAYVQPEAPIDSTTADRIVYWDYPPESYPTFYYYRISAWNDSGEGERSEADGGTRGKP